MYVQTHHHTCSVSVLFRPSTVQNTADNIKAKRSAIVLGVFMWCLCILILYPYSHLPRILKFFQRADFLTAWLLWVAHVVYSSSLSAVTCYFWAESSLPWWEAKTNSNLYFSLNFSSKGIFLPTTRLNSPLLQSCRLWVNFLRIIYSSFPFSPSPHFPQGCLSLIPHHHKLCNSPPPLKHITKSIPNLSCLYLGTPIVLHLTWTHSCSPVPSWTYTVEYHAHFNS